MKNKVTGNKSGGWRSRIIGEGVEHPGQLLANPKNWRNHPPEQQSALTGMLDEVGWVQRVIVNKRTGFVVDGHMRVEVAIKKGEREVPVLYVDLSEEEEAKVLATFDPISGMATMDADKFKKLVSEIEFASKDAEKAIASAADKENVATDSDWPELPESNQHCVTIRFIEEDEPLLKTFIGQFDNKPLDPVSGGKKILERILQIAAETN